MKKYWVFMVIGILFIAIVIFKPFRLEPPTPKISVGETEVPTTQGSYCWDAILLAQCVDTIHTSPIDMTESHTPSIVSKNDEIEIEFPIGYQPEKLRLEQWLDENNSKIIEINNERIKAPDESGVYAYHVIADWNQGDGNYAFLIEVE
ncbi:hypothetical protein KQ939_00580 [Planococcus sp. CP5-4]|uniref:hypothetical protein n=1 Tax=unclassified Planococcus (in: firmicutes) TaxID=2662419 RepID=UPI001C21DDB5|nr:MULTISPECIES: hypothetical protein [unclassified Planococcus (in: firmicutes)]MBU9673362.1 hypothetical protein [Planococcus sp. CP5-4_YE]MBV0908135.1 hypothetical protein [Planococcus sp. CP5-4_UN]MBW6062196.1 hypothetical protein [Planococcus sp. CP5-4]